MGRRPPTAAMYSAMDLYCGGACWLRKRPPSVNTRSRRAPAAHRRLRGRRLGLRRRLGARGSACLRMRGARGPLSAHVTATDRAPWRAVPADADPARRGPVRTAAAIAPRLLPAWYGAQESPPSCARRPVSPRSVCRRARRGLATCCDDPVWWEEKQQRTGVELSVGFEPTVMVNKTPATAGGDDASGPAPEEAEREVTDLLGVQGARPQAHRSLALSR